MIYFFRFSFIQKLMEIVFTYLYTWKKTESKFEKKKSLNMCLRLKRPSCFK